MPEPQHLFVVVDDGPNALSDDLVAAARARGLACVLVDASGVDPLDLPQLGAGDLLVRVGGSHRAMLAEQLLCGPEVATLYADPLGPHRLWDTAPLLLARHGVPVPRATYALPRTEAELRRAVEALGGLPIVLKRPGHSLGNGVMRLDTWTSLVSVVDAFRIDGDQLTLMAYIHPAVHWRVIVVDGAVAAAYRNAPRGDGFRTWVDEADAEAFSTPPPPRAADAAIRATAALGLRAAGVDVLVHESGEVVVLEANLPFWFAHCKRAGGVDVAGCLVDALLGGGG